MAFDHTLTLLQIQFLFFNVDLLMHTNYFTYNGPRGLAISLTFYDFHIAVQYKRN